MTDEAPLPSTSQSKSLDTSPSKPPSTPPTAPVTVPATAPHTRRVRYQGTHPKQFGEKYKELDPALHAAELQKVMARGQTPAGMHRSICVREILDILNPQPGETGLDATLGFGGHAVKMLPRLLPEIGRAHV